MIDWIVSDRCNCCTNMKFAFCSVSQNFSNGGFWNRNYFQSFVTKQKAYDSIYWHQSKSLLAKKNNLLYKYLKWNKKMLFRTKRTKWSYFFGWKCGGRNLAFHCPPRWWKSINFCERPKGNFNGPLYAARLYPFSLGRSSKRFEMRSNLETTEV